MPKKTEPINSSQKSDWFSRHMVAGYLFLAVIALLIIGTTVWWNSSRPTKDSNQVCAQVVTTAQNLQTGEIKTFGTPCDVPEGWEPVDPQPTDAVFCGGFANLPCPSSGYVCNLEGSYPDAGTTCTKQADDFASWKTFSNPKYGFEFKYPAVWSVSDTSQGAAYATFENSLYPDYDYTKFYGAGPLLQIYLSGEDSAQSYVARGFETKDLYTLDGKRGYILDQSVEPIYLFDKNGKAFIIIVNLTPGSGVGITQVRQILSTFKFTDSSIRSVE